MKISLDISKYRKRTRHLWPEDFYHANVILFDLREGANYTPAMIKGKYGDYVGERLLTMYDVDDKGLLTYPDVETAKKVDERNKTNIKKRYESTSGTTSGNTSGNTSGRKRVKKEVKPKEPNPHHKPVIDTYHNWYVDKFGTVPSILVKDTAAVKNIVAYLKKNTKEGMDLIDSWKAILSRWDSLDNWMRNKTSLSQINSNLNEIVTTIRTKSSHEQRTKQEFNDAYQAIIDQESRKYQSSSN